MNYGLWASEKEPELESSSKFDSEQASWEQFVIEVHMQVDRLRSNHDYEASFAFRTVRESIGVKITPWQAVIKKDKLIPEDFRSMVKEALYKLREIQH